MKIGNFEAYPIYSFVYRWIQDRDEKSKDYRVNEDTDLPNHRFRNSSVHQQMFKEEKTTEELETYFNEVLLPQIKERYKDNNISDITHEIKFIKHETWMCQWFSHMTFDIGLSDEEVLKSFEEFVDRTEYNNRRYGNEKGQSLMGAEDRWRWHGNNPDGTRDDEHIIPPPCRCIHCKKHGVVRINH